MGMHQSFERKQTIKAMEDKNKVTKAPSPKCVCDKPTFLLMHKAE